MTSRSPPSFTKPSDSSISIYRVKWERTESGGTCYLERAQRVPFTLKGSEGTFVEFGGGFHPLHPAKELAQFVRKMRKICSKRVYLNSRPFSVATDEALPYVLEK